MTTSKSRRGLTAALTLSAGMTVGTGHAASEVVGLGEVVVTAQKRSERLQDVPIAVSVLSGEELQQSGVNVVQRLPEVTPGLVINDLVGYQQIYIRGIGSEFAQPGVNQSVATHVDGVVIQNGIGVDQSFSDIERVEVLKGPQGSLYGRNATGGAINIITRRPTDELTLETAVGAGNFDQRSASVYLAGPLSDSFKVSFSGLYSRRDSYLTNIGGRPIDDAMKRGGRVKFLYTAPGGAEAVLSIFNLRNDFGGSTAFGQLQPNSIGAAFGGTSSTEFRVVSNNDVYESGYHQKGGSLTGTLPFESFELVSITGFTKFRFDGGADFDATSAPIANFATGQFDETTTQELQLVSDNDSRLRWVSGLFFLNNKAGFDRFLTPDGLGGFDSSTSSSRSKSYAAFAEGTLALRENVNLTAGVRVSRDETTNKGYFLNGAPGINVGREASWNNVSPKLTLDWKRDGTLLYATLSSGTKGGSFNLTNAQQTAPVDPEKVFGLELGIKAEVGPLARIEASAFAYRYSDLQISFIPTQTDPSRLENAERAEIVGLELSGIAEPVEGLRINGGLTWMPNADYTSYRNGSGYQDNAIAAPIFPFGYSVIPMDFTDNRMSRTPEFSANAGIAYRWQLPLGSLQFGTNVFYTDAYWLSAQETPIARQPSYSLVNASLSYETADRHWRFTVAGNNLGDEDYYGSILPNVAGSVSTFAPPRTYSATLFYRY